MPADILHIPLAILQRSPRYRATPGALAIGRVQESANRVIARMDEREHALAAIDGMEALRRLIARHGYATVASWVHTIGAEFGEGDCE